MSAFRVTTDLLTNLMELALFGFGLLRWDSLDRARRLLTAWAGSSVIAAAGTWLLMDNPEYAHALLQLYLPLSALFAMGAMAALQSTRRRRDAFRIAGALYAVVWALLTLTIEDLGTYSIVTGPIHHVLITGGAAFTLQTSLRRAQGYLLADSASVVGMGFLAFAAPTAMIHPVITIFRGEPILDALLGARNVVALLGYAALLHSIALPPVRRAVRELPV